MRVPNKQLFFLIFSSLLIIYEGKDKQTELKNNVPAEHSNTPNWNNTTGGRRENSLSEDEESSDSDDDDEESRNLSAKNTSSSTR